MPYVMVPVPEEHVAAVMQFILDSIEKAAIEAWEPESLGKLWNEVDEAARSLLAFTARATSSEQDLDAAEAARQMQLTQRDVNTILNDLSALARQAHRPSPILARTTTERLPNGRTTERRVLEMEPEVANMIREIERADLLDATPPDATR